MKRFSLSLCALALLAPYAVPAQTPALQHILRYKRASTVCVWPTGSVLLTIDPSDTSKLFTDILATTGVTTDGDSIGAAKDATGNGYDLTAVTGTTDRPVWHNTGGIYRITFDGGDMLRRLANLGMYDAAGSTIVLGVKHNATQQGSVLAEGRSTTTTPYYAPTRNGWAAFNDLYATYRTDGSTLPLNTVLLKAGAYPTTTYSSVIVTDTGSSITGYYDGSPGTSQSYSRAATTLDQFSLGARLRLTSTDDFFVGDLTYLKIYGRVLSSTDIAAADNCVKKGQAR